eukprot:3935829-Amphidinium_carterae.1
MEAKAKLLPQTLSVALTVSLSAESRQKENTAASEERNNAVVAALHAQQKHSGPRLSLGDYTSV